MITSEDVTDDTPADPMIVLIAGPGIPKRRHAAPFIAAAAAAAEIPMTTPGAGGPTSRNGR